MIDKEWFEARIAPITESGCWIWMGGITSKGYGRAHYKGAFYAAHRAAYAIYVGELSEGLCVCHKCDVPACVNPSHLFAGSNQDNVDDKVAKGRQIKWRGKRRGHGNPRALLSEAQVIEIYERRQATGLSALKLSREYGVSKVAVIDILTGRTWAHLNLPARFSKS